MLQNINNDVIEAEYHGVACVTLKLNIEDVEEYGDMFVQWSLWRKALERLRELIREYRTKLSPCIRAAEHVAKAIVHEYFGEREIPVKILLSILE